MTTCHHDRPAAQSPAFCNMLRHYGEFPGSLPQSALIIFLIESSPLTFIFSLLRLPWETPTSMTTMKTIGQLWCHGDTNTDDDNEDPLDSSIFGGFNFVCCTSGYFKAPESSSEFELESESESGGGGSEEDISALKRLVRIERDRANATHLELEKERTAAASAAKEAMAMIQRLQNEKSLVEMQANQRRRP
ncbi:hypothetical protein NE237_003720 [Protea cynaroides]|uniref:GTD-binding domain-containing protein n=1 Tax=Protea cynaroides TaxID=273540 RepID=A0A9Q0KHW9_9MAGN|nr:hypothetical protein NE237_003720 [Protea cynaroides]